jgi:hypothetical protein
MSSPAIGPLLGSGNVADVFEYGEHVLKLYKSPAARAQAFSEAAVTAIVGSHGLPVPAIHSAGNFDGRWGVVMDRAPGIPLAKLVEADRSLVPAGIEDMVRHHLSMHAKAETRLRPLKARLGTNIALATQLDEPLREKLLAGLAGLPDGDRICHGDFHPLNIMGPPGASMIVDWPDATSGPPAADVCRSYVLLKPHAPEVAENYVERYAAAAGLTTAEILAWLPYVAAARLVENVPGETEGLLAMARI